MNRLPRSVYLDIRSDKLNRDKLFLAWLISISPLPRPMDRKPIKVLSKRCHLVHSSFRSSFISLFQSYISCACRSWSRSFLFDWISIELDFISFFLSSLSLPRWLLRKLPETEKKFRRVFKILLLRGKVILLEIIFLVEK